MLASYGLVMGVVVGNYAEGSDLHSVAHRAPIVEAAVAARKQGCIVTSASSCTVGVLDSS